MRNTLILLLLFTLACGIVVLSADHQYVGDAKCKMCHSKQFKSWETTKHAKAYEALKEADLKKDECVGCHTTGYKKSTDLLKGVQCEACHGAGSDYKNMNIMKDKAKAVEAGLIMPTEETCKTCHNEKSPTFKGFKFEEAKKTGVHEHFTK